MTNLNFVPKNVPSDFNVSSRISAEINEIDKSLFDSKVDVNDLWSEENGKIDRWAINDGSEGQDKVGDLNKSSKEAKIGVKKKPNQNINAKEKLNKIKVYFIVKSTNVEEKEFLVAVPINNFDDLSNSSYGKDISTKEGTFLMKTKADVNKKRLIENKQG
ncbi:unnamed protein product, partial [Scytosiphon promiscuus]